MRVKLVCHINADGDLLPAWFEYYSKLGVTSFHLVVHGTPEENEKLYELIYSHPVFIEDTYQGEFTSEQQQRHINSLLVTLRGGWILLVDSDEFVELPYARLNATIRKLEHLGANALFAPMIQRMTLDGSLNSAETISDPFSYFQLCSNDLYGKMGVAGATNKYPLFFCNYRTFIFPGNHYPPHGSSTVLSHLQGVTHHFKWRKPVLDRLAKRANTPFPYRHESAGYLGYLDNHGYRLPIEGSFYYSRRELFRRGFLRSATTCNQEYIFDACHINKWCKQTFLAIKEIASIIPVDKNFILVDEDQFSVDFFAGRHFIPFLEHNGLYCGPPPDDETAIQEFERLWKSGASFIVFGFPAFWWLDYYANFHEYLRSNFNCVMENDRLVVFDLLS
jgi:hypothetical protein